MQSAFMVCATYRNDEKPSPLRFFGILHLIEEAKSQSFAGSVNLAIVDSSPTPHPFFVSPKALLAEQGIAYIHIPNRQADLNWRKEFNQASAFVPTDTMIQNDANWLQQAERMKAWDYFLPFEEGFRQIYKGPKLSEFMSFDRPTIGMKKNTGIMALTEKFGSADAIIFCDDDDRHHTDYVSEVTTLLEANDFVRPTNWISMVVGETREQDIWGRYDVPFTKDVNGNWQIPDTHINDIFDSSMKDGKGGTYQRAVAEKFSRPLNLAFPPLSHDGALHSYSYNVWEKSVELFGGCAPTSFCEDLLFYRLCKDNLPSFSPTALTTDRDLFIRCADGSNASLIEWNKALSPEDRPEWANAVAAEISRNLHSQIDTEKVKEAGLNFLKTGKIDWDKMTGNPVRYPGVATQNVNTNHPEPKL